MRTLNHINIKYFKYACDEVGKETQVDISARCILCGDSEKNKKQKRLHLYTKDSYEQDAVKCFNCEWTGNMYSFLREVDSSLFEQYKRETREKSFNSLAKKREKRQEFNDASIQMGNYTRKERAEPPETKAEPVHQDSRGSKKRRSYAVDLSGFGETNGSPSDKESSGQPGTGNNDGNENETNVFSTTSSGPNGSSESNSTDGTKPEDGRGVGGSTDKSIGDFSMSTNRVPADRTVDDKIKRLGVIPDDVFEMPDKFRPALESDSAISYLQGRGLDPANYFWSDDWVKFRGKNMPLKNCIIVPLWVMKDENVLYGFQARSIESKFFYTYIPDENTGFKVWNWYGIDKSKPTFIFESVFDAESSGLPQHMICAALGADLNDERLKELSDPIFALDNQVYDTTSRRKTVQNLKGKYKCFVWDKSMKFKDTNDAIKGGISKATMRSYILDHIETGMTGIIKCKLKR